MTDKNIITISQTAQFLGVSLDTLRRWDKNKKLPALRPQGAGHRYYDEALLADFILNSSIYKLILKWAASKTAIEPLPDFYCPNSSIFQARLERFEAELAKISGLKNKFSLLTAITGEIGGNAYDHNLGNWPDLPGIFFIYNLPKGLIAIADRGQGVLATLKKIRPNLSDDQSALETAFTEIISGRAPESRGNGLKFVRKIVAENNFRLLFQSGRAELTIKSTSGFLNIGNAKTEIQGCLALIKF